MNFIIAVRTSAAAALFALAILPLSARAASRTHVYMLQGGAIIVRAVAPNGQVARESTRVPTIAAGGILDALAATPSGRFLYVEGCIDKPFGILKRTEAIAAYDISEPSGIPRPIGSPVSMGGCFEDALPQTLVIDVGGRYLFSAGGFSMASMRSYAAAASESSTLFAFRIGEDGHLMQVASLDIPGMPVGARLALDASGRWLSYVGPQFLDRGKYVPAVTEVAVQAGGALVPAKATPLFGAVEIGALRSNPRVPATLYIGVDGVRSERLVAYRIGVGGALSPPLFAYLGASSRIAVNRNGTSLFAMGMCRYPRRQFNCTEDDVAEFAIERSGVPHPTSAVKPPVLTADLVLQPPYRYLYATEARAGFRGTSIIGAATVVGPPQRLGGSLCLGPEGPSPGGDLYGPADMVGVDPREIVRVVPANGSRTSSKSIGEIQFSSPDFPWRFSPDPASGIPWVALAILKTSEFTIAHVRGSPLSAIRVTNASDLPNVDDLAPFSGYETSETGAVQRVLGPPSASALAPFQSASNSVWSWVDGPRALEPDTAYDAFLIPTFCVGWEAGLGEPIARSKRMTAGAVVVPYYYSFGFTTLP